MVPKTRRPITTFKPSFTSLPELVRLTPLGALTIDSIKKREISVAEAGHKQEEFDRYLKKITGNTFEKQKEKIG